MNITNVKIRIIQKSADGIRATAAVTIEESIVIHDIMITERGDRVQIVMPNRRCADGHYRDIVHPADSASREQLTRAITESYRKARSDYRRERMLREAADYYR